MKKLPVTLSKEEFRNGLILLAVQQLILPVLLGFGAALLPKLPSEAELNFAYFLINFISSLVIFRNFLWAELDVALQKPSRVLSSVAIAYLIYYASSTALSYLIAWIDPNFFNLNDANLGQMTQNQFAIMTVGTVILVPPAEELLFRGVLFNRLYAKRPIIACIVSVVCFCLVHLIGYIGQYSPLAFFLAFLQYIPAGAALCFAYIRSGTIFAPILFHTLINAMAVAYQVFMR